MLYVKTIIYKGSLICFKFQLIIEKKYNYIEF